MKRKNLQKFLSVFCSILILSSPFQTYAFAKGISKVTSIIYSSKNENHSNNNLLVDNSAQSSNAATTSTNQSSNIVSDAYNYKDLTKNVDPRTGAFSISYKIADVVGNGFEDPMIPLSINYSSLSQADRFGLGKGWAWNLTYYDTKTGMLSLSNGGTYKLDIGQGKLKYYKLNDLKIEIGSIYLTLKYKDGREEKIEKTFGNLLSVTNKEGYQASFNYINGSKLQSIIYKDLNSDSDIKKIELIYSSNTFITIKLNNGTNNLPTTTLTKSNNSNLLTSIKNPLLQEVKFSYGASSEKDFSTDSLVTKISFPTGTSVNVSYLTGGLNSPLDGISFPAVSKIETNSFTLKSSSNKLGMNTESISYIFNQDSSNYLGKGFTGYKEGEDTLFYTPNTYTYSSIESKDSPTGSNIKTERIYNHFHQLMSEKIKENDNLIQTKEYNYPEWKSKSFASLEANYNYPIEVKTTYYKDGSNRTEVVKNSYDNSGNILKTIEANGIIKEYQYLSAENTFNGLVHLVEKEIKTSPIDKVSLITEYKYENTQNLRGKTFQRALAKVYRYNSNICGISDVSCGKVYKTELYTYNKDTNKFNIYSLPSVVKIKSASGGKCKVSINKNTYSLNSNFNTTNKEYIDYKGNILAKETLKINSFTKKEENKIETDGKNISYQYDNLGRVLKETITSVNGESSISTNYLYYLNDSKYGLGFGTSAVLVMNPNGYSTYKVNDSLGREIQTFLQSKYDSSFNLISSISYNSTGQKDSQSLYDIDKDGYKYQISTKYKYDVLARENMVVSPNGETKVTNYDDAKNSSETYMISNTGNLSSISVSYFDLNKKPIRLELLTKDRTLFSKSLSVFDGFGNLIESTDVNGNVVKFKYSPLSQKVQDIFSDGRKISYDYDPLLNDKIIKKSVITSDGSTYTLGSREYDSIGQLVSESDPFGKSIKYIYDLYGNVVSKTLRSGKEIKYLYNGFNKLIKKQVLGEESNYTTNYEYDSFSMYLVNMIDSTGKTKYTTFKDGKLKSVTYPDGKAISYEYNLQDYPVNLTDINQLKSSYIFNKSSGRLEKIQYNSKDGIFQEENYYYDDFGRILYKVLPNNTKVSYSYNSMGALNSLSYTDVNNSNILSYTYSYNLDMNIASRNRYSNNSSSVDSQENYSYDSLNNLQKYVCTGALCPRDTNGNIIKSEEYSFDSLNNIKTAKVKYSDSTPDSITTYNYNKTDGVRLEGYSTTGLKNTSSTLEYDEDGNIIKDGNDNKLVYTPFQRLSKFISKDKTIEYSYNGSGEIISQNDSENGLVKFYYNGNKIINENSNGKIVSYLQINGYIIGKVNPGSVFQFYLTDQARSVIRVMEGAKLLTKNFVYTPYGEQFDVSNSAANSSKLSDIGFNGERTDGKTGYQFLGKGYRAYNPALGRFMQYDTQSPFGKGGINGYIFAENNPIMKFDPTGENAANVMLGVGLGLSILGIFLSIFTLGTTLAPAIAGTAALSAADIAITVAASAGIASSVIGITGQVYGKLSSDANAAGNKADATKYGDISYALGWTSFALGMAASAVSIGVEVSSLAGVASAAKNTSDNIIKLGSSNANKITNNNYLSDMYNISISDGIRVSSQFKYTKMIMGYTSDAAWIAGKGFGEASRNAGKAGDNEKSDLYGKIATDIFWLSLTTGGVSASMSLFKSPLTYRDTVDKLNVDGM